MKTEYVRTKTTVSFIRYHFVFCPYRRRKIFDIPDVEDRFKELVYEICKKYGFEVIAMECHHDHVHLFLSATPKYGPSGIMRIIKGTTSKILREEFQKLSKMRFLWTRSYFVSTAENVSASTIKKYVETQKTRS